jgi:hypothetical protein
MKVICIDINNINIRKDKSHLQLFTSFSPMSEFEFNLNFDFKKILTIGKQYNVQDIQVEGTLRDILENPSSYRTAKFRILCDDGYRRDIDASRFISIEVNREKIINEILK